MKPMTAFGLVLAMMMAGTAQADTFGTSGNEFTIDFVYIGNAGNVNDAGAGGGIYFSDYGGVGYNYRMSKYEISQDAITKATASGMTNVTAGWWTGSQPAADISWYEAAAFVNWLNTSEGYQSAYNLTYSGGWSMTLWSSGEAWQQDGENLYRHKNAYYFLPSEDEWYKAAYHKNDGVTANYWDYPTGSNTEPMAVANGTLVGTTVYGQPALPGPADIDNAGGLSSYGTMGQGGNVWEWMESANDGSNNVQDEFRAIRGGRWGNLVNPQRSSFRGSFTSYPYTTFSGDVGFRVASVPEPSAAMLLLMAGGAWLLRRRSSPIRSL